MSIEAFSVQSEREFFVCPSDHLVCADQICTVERAVLIPIKDDICAFIVLRVVKHDSFLILDLSARAGSIGAARVKPRQVWMALPFCTSSGDLADHNEKGNFRGKVTTPVIAVIPFDGGVGTSCSASSGSGKGSAGAEYIIIQSRIFVSIQNLI